MRKFRSSKKFGGFRGYTSTYKATKLQKDVSRLKRQMGQVELKFADKQVDDAVISTTGSVQLQLFVIPQNDTQSGRHGRKIVLTSVHLRGIIGLGTSTVVGEGSDTMRIIMLKDNSANGALPAVLDILTLASWESFINLENKSRFRVLADRFVSINCNGVAGDGTTNDTSPTEKYFSIYKKLNLTIEYNDTASTGDIATINTNNIVVLFISRLGNVQIESCIRFRYTDM